MNLAAHWPDRLASLAVFDPDGVVALDMLGSSRWGVPTMLGSFLPPAIRRRVARSKRHPMAEDAVACRLLLLGTLLHRPGIPTRTLLSDEELRDIRVPVTLVVGEHTEMFDTSAIVSRIGRLVPRSASTVVRGAGHALSSATCEPAIELACLLHGTCTGPHVPRVRSIEQLRTQVTASSPEQEVLSASSNSVGRARTLALD